LKYDEAKTWADQSLKLFLELRDDYGAAAASRHLGMIYQSQGDLDHALQLYLAGFEKARQFNDTKWQQNLQCHLLSSIASVHLERRQFQDAQQKYENALAIYQATGDAMGIAETLHQLGKIAFALKRYSQAEQLYGDSLKAIENTPAELVEAEIFYSQALLAERQGYLELAQEKLKCALERFQNLQAAEGLARTEKLLNQIRNMLGSQG
jgi:tetratricopeptide (TPR) repeat protein